MTAKGLHDPIVNQYRPHHRMCGCCEPAAPAADCWEIVNAYGVSTTALGAGCRDADRQGRVAAEGRAQGPEWLQPVANCSLGRP